MAGRKWPCPDTASASITGYNLSGLGNCVCTRNKYSAVTDFLRSSAALPRYFGMIPDAEMPPAQSHPVQHIPQTYLDEVVDEPVITSALRGMSCFICASASSPSATGITSCRVFPAALTVHSTISGVREPVQYPINDNFRIQGNCAVWVILVILL